MQQIPSTRQSLLDRQVGTGSVPWVLDTNVVLDLFVFQDARCTTLAGALAGAPGSWVATPAMRAEFDSVTARSAWARWAARVEVARQGWRDLATLVDAPAASRELCCDDAKDQMFLDLAVWIRPCWLLTWDRQVLRLRRRAAALEIRIATPTEWRAQTERGDATDRIAP